MRFLTIRMKMTLWYAFFMLLLIGFSLLLISDLSVKAMLTNQKQNLVETVADGVDDLGRPGTFDYYQNGVYLCLYDQQEQFMEGAVPEGFDISQPLRSDYVRTISVDQQEYYVYDKLHNTAKGAYWLRGAIPYSAPDVVGTALIGLVSWFLPVYVLITCVIGYFITRRAFLPVRKIQETAQSITDGDELSRRIGLPEGKDEIARLGHTVDHMLDKLQHSFEKEKQFTSDVSHELRTPLTVILTESEYGLQHADSLEEARESLEVVNRQAGKMSLLINQLLFFSRSDNGTLLLHKETFTVIPVISEVVQDYQVLADLNGMTIATAYEVPSDTAINGDKTLFIRCLSNLLSNAVNYSGSGGHIEVTVSQGGGFLSAAVADQGIGIRPEHLGKIWDRFYQVDTSRNKDTGGSMGLGLSMVKMIIEKHGGKVAVSSTPGKGSTFTLFFPL